jgi:predicted nuclease of predicted toxin-antitoxin system
MRLLIDECLPRKVKVLLAEGGHACETVPDAGLAGKQNGELLALAEGEFDVLITIDKNIRYQQNVAGRQIAILIIRAASNDIEDVRPQISHVLTALESIRPGEIVEVGNP